MSFSQIYTFLTEIYATFGKMYTNLHNRGAGAESIVNPRKSPA